MGARVRLVYRHQGCITAGLTASDFVTRLSADRKGELILMQAPTALRLAELAAAFRAYSGDKVEVLGESERAVLFRACNPPDAVVAALDATGCTLLLPSVYTDGVEHLDIVAPDEDAARRLLQTLRADGEIVSAAVGPVPVDELAPSFRAAELIGDLTPRQLDALLAAVALGYYASPRGTTAAEVASKQGLARTTLEEHLRKAENHLIARLADLLAKYPFRARVARRGTGRPRRRVASPESPGLRR